MEERRSKRRDTHPVGFYLVLEMDGNSDTRYYVDSLAAHHVKLSRSAAKIQILYDSTCIRNFVKMIEMK